MSETVDDYHGYSRKNRKCSSSIKKKKTGSPDKSAPDTLSPENSRRLFQQSHLPHLGHEVDNSFLGETHEHELFKVNSKPVDGDAVNASKDDVAVAWMAADDPLEIKLPKVDSKYFDLIKAGRRDQITLEPEDVDHDLIAELAKSLSSRDQNPAVDFENEPVAGRKQNQSVHTDRLQNLHAPGLWSRRMKFGSAAMLVAGVAVVLLVKTQELNGGGEENTQIALASNLIDPNPNPVAVEKSAIASSLPAGDKNFEASSVNRFVPPPVLEDGSQAGSQLDSMSDSQVDEERVVKIENLNKNLKIVRAYLSSQQLAYSDATVDEKPKLMEEVTKIKSELISLVGKINSLQPPAIGAPSTEIAGITPTPGKIEKTALGAISKGDGDGADVTVALPVFSSKPRKTRNPAKVELALAAMPGLYRLQSVSRRRLKSKLISGECLVPALSSVFPQVPALVMRDMVRQFDGQC